MIKAAAFGIFLSVVCLAGLPASSGLSNPATEDISRRFDSFVKQTLEDDSIPGAGLVVTESSGSVYLKGYGITSVDDPQPVTPDTLFCLASVSKSFTALGVLLLRDRGLIDISQPVTRYLPEFELGDGSENITVEHLLTQTSGIPGSLAEPQGYFNGPDAMTRMVEELKGLKLNSRPGEVFEYSNLNYFLLGAVVEAVAGVSFEQYMQENVFDPLGLDHTTLYPERAQEMGQAYGHQTVFGRVVQRSMPVYRSAAPAGWVMSTARDMGRWLALFMNKGRLDGEQFVSESTIAGLTSPHVYYEKDGYRIGYGMGWLIGTDENGVRRLWHGGDTPSFLADMLILPDYDTGVCVMVNGQTGTGGHSLAPGIAGIFLGMDIGQLGSPWWAHWKTIDTMSFGGIGLISLLLGGWVFFLWRIGIKIRRRQYLVVKPNVASRWLPAWKVGLFVAPLCLLGVLALSGYLTVNSLYGYNIFTVMLQSFLAVPPSTWATGTALLSMIGIWALTLALAGLIIRRAPSEVN